MTVSSVRARACVRENLCVWVFRKNLSGCVRMSEPARAHVFAHKGSVFFRVMKEGWRAKQAARANKDARFLFGIIKMYDCLDQMHKKSRKQSEV